LTLWTFQIQYIYLLISWSIFMSNRNKIKNNTITERYGKGINQMEFSMVVGFKTTFCNQCRSPLKLSVRIQSEARCSRYNFIWLRFHLLTAGRWFFPGTLVSFANKTDLHDNSNIVERRVKHPNPNPLFVTIVCIYIK